MFLTLTGTVDTGTVDTCRVDTGPATDLGLPAAQAPRAGAGQQPAGRPAHVFYPAATPQLCTVALLLEVDPVGLVLRRRGHG